MAGWRAYSFECFAIHSALIFLCAIFSFLQESRAFSATMQIFVVVPDGSSSVVEIAGYATVGALKHAIEDVQFVPADQQQIAFSEDAQGSRLRMLLVGGTRTVGNFEVASVAIEVRQRGVSQREKSQHLATGAIATRQRSPQQVYQRERPEGSQRGKEREPKMELRIPRKGQGL